MSIFGISRCGSSLSVLDFFNMGSAMSVRSMGRLGSSLALFKAGRLGASLSVLDFFHLGSSLSVRTNARMGSHVSLFGVARLGSTLSVIDFSTLGSAMSVRSFYRLGSRLSVFTGVRFGSSLSVLDFVNLGNTLSVSTIRTVTISDGTQDTYLKFASTTLELYAGTQKGLTVTANGGNFHGAWAAEATITTSDRRLKRNIEPLYRTMADRARDRWSSSSAAATSATKPKDQPVNWLLRELRPVSFHLKRGAEAKYLKFGFIAQELETVFPNLVRTLGDDQTKAVASQDLIAVLMLAAQNLQKELEGYKAEMLSRRERLERMERAVMRARPPPPQV